MELVHFHKRLFIVTLSMFLCVCIELILAMPKLSSDGWV